MAGHDYTPNTVWEYHIAVAHIEDANDTCRALGLDGWEAYAVEPATVPNGRDARRIYFKRPQDRS